ncbi:MAG: universal stress protein [Ginsengibacter sp.]|jgi:nucleotide-binding universal stress UspA family protein
MKNFLVPIDFSDTSINAAKYAIGLTKDVPEAHITLYHVYSKISFATLSSKEEGSRQKVSEEALQEVVTKINGGNSESISIVAEEGSFLESIKDYVMGHYTDMVIMGITGSSRITQVFMGTNTLNVIRHISCPVMIIPAEAHFTGFKHGVFISDFKDVARTTPFAALQNILDTFKPELDILNVDSEHFVELTEEFKLERSAMEDKLGKYDPNFSFLRAYDVLDGINSYVETKEIDVIISVPRKHSFLSQLFKTSHTKKLAYHSTVPILAIPG